MKLIALPPQGDSHGQRTEYMAAKILLGVSFIFSLTSGALATWAVQSDPIILDERTWIPMGVAIGVFAFGVAAAIRATRMWDDRGGRLEEVEEDVDQVLAALYGPEDDVTGMRPGGLVQSVKQIEGCVHDIQRALTRSANDGGNDE